MNAQSEKLLAVQAEEKVKPFDRDRQPLKKRQTILPQ